MPRSFCQFRSPRVTSKKAYTVTELETLDAKLAASVAERIAKAQVAAGGKNFRTGGGKVTSMGGPPPPQRVAITEWDNVEKAQAFFKSKVWNDLAPASRRYAAMWWKNGTKSINAQSGGRFIWRSPSK